MHTEAVKTRIFHMTPVTEDAQLHISIHHVTGALHVAKRGEKKRIDRQRGENIKKEGTGEVMIKKDRKKLF